jgi:hypothetical protein
MPALHGLPRPALRRSLFLAAALLSGCATTDFGPEREVRAATEVPDHFLVGTPDGSETSEPVPGEGCRNPMVDPRDGAAVQLVRSSGTRADYEVPDGRYGVGRGELLRLACDTGRVIGVVDR